MADEEKVEGEVSGATGPTGEATGATGPTGDTA